MGLSRLDSQDIEMHLILTEILIADIAEILDSTGTFVKIAGDTMTGDLNLDTNLNLVTTTATEGIINVNSTPFIHSFGTASTYFGLSAGNLTNTASSNLGLGANSLKSVTTGGFNVGLGKDSLQDLTTSFNNLGIGTRSLMKVTTGTGSNVGVGVSTMEALTTGIRNTAVGHTALFGILGNLNTSIGWRSGRFVETGANNVFIGALAGTGASGHDKSGDVFIGFSAGQNELGSNLLYIANSNTATPLIKGDFSANTLIFNANVTIGVGAAGVDYTLTFNGESDDGVITYDEDNNLFNLADTGITTTGNLVVNAVYISTTVDALFALDSQPDDVGSGVGIGHKMISSKGGDKTGPDTSITGDAGGGFTMTSGVGGEVSGATTLGQGGAGGTFSMTGGVGGVGSSTDTSAANQGGAGGGFSMTGGVGGVATVSNTGENDGGVGGAFQGIGGKGGAADNGSGDFAGGGGFARLRGGIGGTSTGGTPGLGGDVLLEGGQGGVGGVGVGGDVTLNSGIGIGGDHGKIELAIGNSIVAVYLANRNGLHFRDDKALILGTGLDSSIFYNNTNLIIDPDLVGSGRVLIGATGDDDMLLNDIEIDGDLNHDGSNIGFYGTTPAAQSSAYTRNATIVEDRTLLASASATTLNNNNVLAALIADLQAIGLIA